MHEIDQDELQSQMRGGTLWDAKKANKAKKVKKVKKADFIETGRRSDNRHDY